MKFFSYIIVFSIFFSEQRQRQQVPVAADFEDFGDTMDEEARTLLKSHRVSKCSGNVMELYCITNVKSLKWNFKQDDVIERLEFFVKDPKGASAHVDFTQPLTRIRYLSQESADFTRFTFNPVQKICLRNLMKFFKRKKQTVKSAAV